MWRTAPNKEDEQDSIHSFNYEIEQKSSLLSVCLCVQVFHKYKFSKFNLQLENHFIRSNSQQNRFDFILNYGTMQTFIIFQKLNTEDIQDDKNWQKKTTTINNTNYQNLWKTRAIKKRQWELTSLLRAAVAVWRSAGSNARRVSMRGSDDSGKSLNVSLMHLL